MRILFLPNFNVVSLQIDDPKFLPANKNVIGNPYWFFKYWPKTIVEIIDSTSIMPFSIVEKKLKIMILQQIKSFLKNKKFELIISHSYNSGFGLSLFRTFFGESTPPHIIIDVGCLNGQNENPFQIKILQYATKSLSGIVYHSKINERFYEKYFSAIPRKFIPYGEDPEFFKPLTSVPTEKYVLSFGYAKRDYETLINVWIKNKIGIPLVIVGKTSFKYSLPKQIKIFSRVNILCLKQLIHNSKFVILPIENEPYSTGQMSLLQSMLMEKAVIVNSVPGIIDYVEDGKNVLLTKYKSETDLLSNVNYLMDNPSERSRISKNARITVINNFTEKIMSERIFNFIKYEL